jgi:hypothetical protein
MTDRLSDAEVAWHVDNPAGVMGNSKQLQRLAREVLEWRRVYPRQILADHVFEQQVGSNMCVCGEPDINHSPTLRLVENFDKHPVRFQAVCTSCGWHWPQGGYVTESTARSVYAQHDCAMHASNNYAALPLRSAAPTESLLTKRRRKDLARIHRPALDEEGVCTVCGVPDVHCQCPDIDATPASDTSCIKALDPFYANAPEREWQADDVAPSYSSTAAVMDQTVVDE